MGIRNSTKFTNIRSFAKKYKELDFSVIEACLYLLGVGQAVGEAMDAHFARHNLSRGRFSILMSLLHKDGPLSPAELADSCAVSRATVTGLLDTLEQAQLIARIHDTEDRRSLQVRLTPEGEEHLRKMLPEHYRRVAGMMQELTGEERTTLVALLEKIERGIPVVRDP